MTGICLFQTSCCYAESCAELPAFFGVFVANASGDASLLRHERIDALRRSKAHQRWMRSRSGWVRRGNGLPRKGRQVCALWSQRRNPGIVNVGGKMLLITTLLSFSTLTLSYKIHSGLRVNSSCLNRRQLDFFSFLLAFWRYFNTLKGISGSESFLTSWGKPDGLDGFTEPRKSLQNSSFKKFFFYFMPNTILYWPS